MRHPHQLNAALWGSFVPSGGCSDRLGTVCVCVWCSVVWAALAKLAPLQKGQIFGGKKAAKDAKTHPTENKNRKLCILSAGLSKDDSEVWGQTDLSPGIPEGKGKICFLGGLQESELELPGSVVITAPLLGL